MLISQKFIYRSDLRNNSTVLYLFGDNLTRLGMGGQAKEMRGEKNAIGIATKRAPSMNEDAFFSDDDFAELAAQIVEDFTPALKHLVSGGIVIVPEDGLGTGFSELPKRAPRLQAFINTILHYAALGQWQELDDYCAMFVGGYTSVKGDA